MTVLDFAYLGVATICFVVGLQHLLLALRAEDRRPQLLFSLASMGVVGDALLEREAYSSETADQFLGLMPWTALCICTTIVAVSCYLALRTGIKRVWLLWTLVVLSVLTVVGDFAVGIAFSGPVQLVREVLPWGDSFSRLVGDSSSLRVVGDLLMIGFVVFLVDLALRMVRRGDRRTTRLIVGSLAVYSLALFMIIPVDLGWIRLPSLHTFAFLFIVAAMSWDVSNELIRAAQLTKEVVAGERRWRQLLDDVHLLAVRIDAEGRIVEVNPHFERVMGYSTSEVMGHEYWTFVTEEQREERRQAFLNAMAGDLTLEVEVDARCKAGERKRIVWRNVILRDADLNIEGMLSIGADITDRVAAEADRDRALTDLERTVAQLEILKTRLEAENIQLREQADSSKGHDEIIGSSDPMLYVLHKVDQVAGKDATVLIQGETGVGKELVARSIHRSSNRSAAPFVAVNCATIAKDLAESQLFGHEKGAFTGADRMRPGRFEMADGGTLFLDEVGELPLDVQPKLLRVLQEGEIERVGGSKTLPVDVRLIVATNRNLRTEVEAGSFREDLFYRLEVYPITVPPLRERTGDIQALVSHFAQQFGAVHGTQVREIPADLMRRFEEYAWPGNVRELMNIVERSVLASNDGVLRLAQPLEELLTSRERVNDESTTGAARLATLEEVERSHIEAVLKACNGQISGRGGAALVLAMHPNTLRSRIKKLGISAGRNDGKIG